MVKYFFRGTIKRKQPIPFELKNGIVSFDLQFKNLLPFSERKIVLSGSTDDGRHIYLLINSFYERGREHIFYDGKEMIVGPHIEGEVGACVVLESASINDIDSIGFFSLAIPQITGCNFSGMLNDDNSAWMKIKEPVGKYLYKSHEYRLSIGFIDNNFYNSGQLLELKRDEPFDIKSMAESYWLIKKLLVFLCQKRNIPLEDVYLRAKEKNVGRLFVEQTEPDMFGFKGVKCIQLNVLGNKLDCLLQLIADQKVYLWHVPMFKGEENSYTPGRFLIALAGLENTLDYMGIYANHSEKYIDAVNEVKNTINRLVDESAGEVKNVYKRFLKQLNRYDNLESRILASLNDDKEYIINFFPLDVLGDAPNVAKDLSDVRNDLAHGDLNANLGLKSNYQMHFLMLYILYLQLKMIGFNKREASRIVPHILFEN